MDFLELIRVTLRRWYITLPLIALTVALAMRMSGEIQPEYSASASLILVGPSVVISDDRGLVSEELLNPYLSFSGSLNTTADALRLAMSGQAVKRDLAGRGLTTVYTAVVDRRSPVLTFTATSQSRQVAIDTIDRLSNLLSDELALRQSQAGAPPRQRISAVPLATSQAGPDHSERRQVRLLVGAFGSVIAVAMGGIFEGFARSRRARRDARRQAEAMALELARGSDAALDAASAPKGRRARRRARAQARDTGAGSAPATSPVSLAESPPATPVQPAEHRSADPPAPVSVALIVGGEVPEDDRPSSALSEPNPAPTLELDVPPEPEMQPEVSDTEAQTRTARLRLEASPTVPSENGRRTEKSDDENEQTTGRDGDHTVMTTAAAASPTPGKELPPSKPRRLRKAATNTAGPPKKPPATKKATTSSSPPKSPRRTARPAVDQNEDSRADANGSSTDRTPPDPSEP